MARSKSTREMGESLVARISLDGDMVLLFSPSLIVYRIPVSLISIPHLYSVLPPRITTV